MGNENSVWCGQQEKSCANCNPNCFAANKHQSRLDYEPPFGFQHDAEKESLDPLPTKAEDLKKKNNVHYSDSRNMQFDYKISDANGPHYSWSSKDDGSYFTREIVELSALPANFHIGSRPTYTFRNGGTYRGEWKGNARHGIGLQAWIDGAKYLGRWANSCADGLGRFIHSDGDVFVGQWNANAARGFGTYHHKKGKTTYRGTWIEDLQHGSGVETWDGGSSYRGQFVYGKKEGYGVYEWPDGSIYQGEWLGNSINGQGRYIGKDGRQFRGQWKNAVIDGCGEYTWPDGRSFRGQYVNDQKDGFGIFTWKDKRRFVGFWLQGKQHGKGATYRASGEVIKKGVWIMGVAPENPELATEGNFQTGR